MPFPQAHLETARTSTSRSVERAGSEDDNNATDFHEAYRDLVLSGATVTIMSSSAQPDVVIAVAVYGRALGDIELLLAHAHDVAVSAHTLDHAAESALDVRPIQLNVLSSKPVVEISASALYEPMCVDLTLQLQVHHRGTETATLITHRFTGITLSETEPTTRLELTGGASSSGSHH